MYFPRPNFKITTSLVDVDSGFHPVLNFIQIAPGERPAETFGHRLNTA